MSRALRLTAGVLVVAALISAAQIAAPGYDSRASTALLSAPASAGLNGGYPRLANYNGFATQAQVPFFTAYDVVVAQRGAPIGALQAANPHVVTLLYERALQADLCCTNDLYGLDPSQVPPGWWLVGAGSRLPLAIGPDQDWIPVDDVRPFAPCQDILVDGESMHVWGVEGNWLHVQRGYYSTATGHLRGARVAPHVSYRVDRSNCDVTGPNAQASLRPWSLNLSSACPRWHGMTWANYLALRIAHLVQRDGWSGVFYDNLTDFPFSPAVDTNNDGRADGGIIKGRNVWRDGERALLAETRKLLPHRPIVVNGDLQANGLADGREMEGFPVIPGLALQAAIDSYLADTAAGAPMSIVNPDTVDRPTANAQTAELAVGVALLGDGYAAYDRGWISHGDSWWFDPFDNGAGSALLRPVGPWTASLVVAHPWRFQAGETVLMDQEAAVVTGVTPHTITVERGMYGTVAAPHPTGTSVTTSWQRMQGHGYLGLPSGPARLVPTEQWEPSALPLGLVRRAEAGVTSLRPFAFHVLGTTSLVEVRTGLHYNPDASGVNLLPSPSGPVLRTLDFSARGRAGQTIWVTGGKTAVSLTVQPRWHRYVLPIGNDALITIGTGRAGGRLTLRDMRLYGVQAYVWRRDFTHGIVLVNPTDRVQHVVLERPYLPATGDQEAAAASQPTCDLALGRYRAAILLRVTDTHARCPAGLPRFGPVLRGHRPE